MSNFKSSLDIYKILNKSNCRQCQLSTCMAFAVSVFRGEKSLEGCPHIDQMLIEQLGEKAVQRNAFEQNGEALLRLLKKEITSVDFLSAAKRLGVRLVEDKLVIKCLGKDFFIDNEGNVDSECHIKTWLEIILLHYTVSSKGNDPKGNWIRFTQLKEGMAWNNFFLKQCEEELKRIADVDEQLFFDIAQIFGGSKLNKSSSADWSIVLYPLPKVPFLIRYWKPEDDFESDLKIFFDESVNSNLSTEAIYSLGVGIAAMFKSIMRRHSKTGQLNININ